VEETLDAVAYAVEALVAVMFCRVSGMRRDDRLHAPGFHSRADPLRIVSRITDKGAPLCVLKERLGNRGLMSLTRCQLDVERSPFCVDDNVDFCGESTT
jgi:hypothetical protein